MCALDRRGADLEESHKGPREGPKVMRRRGAEEGHADDGICSSRQYVCACMRARVRACVPFLPPSPPPSLPLSLHTHARTLTHECIHASTLLWVGGWGLGVTDGDDDENQQEGVEHRHDLTYINIKLNTPILNIDIYIYIYIYI